MDLRLLLPCGSSVPANQLAMSLAFPKVSAALDFQRRQHRPPNAASSLRLALTPDLARILAGFAMEGALAGLLSPCPRRRAMQLRDLIPLADEYCCEAMLRDARAHLLLRGGGGDLGVVAAVAASCCCTLLDPGGVISETAVDLIHAKDVAWGGGAATLGAVRVAATGFILRNFEDVVRKTEGFIEYFGGDETEASLGLLSIVAEEVNKWGRGNNKSLPTFKQTSRLASFVKFDLAREYS